MVMEMESVEEDGSAWDEERLRRLIKLVFRCQWVWNTKRVDYRDRVKKAKTWRTIGHEMNVSDREAMGKFKYLRNKFNVEKSKFFNSPASTGQAPTSNWPLFEEMKQFYVAELLTLQARASGGSSAALFESIPIQNDDSGSVISDFGQYSSTEIDDFNSSVIANSNHDPFATAIASTIDNVPMNLTGQSETSRKRKSEAVDQSFFESVNGTQSLISEQNTGSAADEFEHFGRMVAAKLRRLPEHVADSATMDILKVLNFSSRGISYVCTQGSAESFDFKIT